MTFLNPVFFWAFLGLIPLAAIYFLKVRPRKKPTTAFFLWEQIFKEKRTTALFKRLRSFWSLLLMMLAFCAVALAMTAPQWISEDRKDALILIDHSASMSANDGNGSRLDSAKKVAAEIIRALNGSQRVALASVGNTLVYHSHLTDNPRQLLNAVDGIKPSVQRFNTEVFENSYHKQPWSSEHRVILLTDGCFDRSNLPQHIELLKVGEPGENAGIIAADMQYIPGPDRQLGLYFQTASTFAETVQADLMVNHIDASGKKTLFKLIPLQIQPGVNKASVYSLDDAEPGRWTAQLDLDDALPSDNVVNLSVALPRPVRVSVQSDDRFFLENSVVAFSQDAGLLTLVDQDPQIVLSQGASTDNTHSLIFKPQGESPWWSELGKEPLDAVVPRLLIDDHPALRYIDVTSISFAGARNLKVPEGAQVWVATDDGIPLIYRASHSGNTAIVVNMDPTAAEFYYSAWFPVLVHSAATHLAGREESLTAGYRPSDIVTIPGAQLDETTQVIDPSGAQDDTTSTTLPPLEQLGFYQLNNSSGDWLVGCSLLSPSETSLDNSDVTDTSKPINRGWPPAQLLTALAIVVLTTESLLYHRRKVG
ncbi:MAG: BatA and WFA domain-containing protein [Planctomycetales bacterium]